MGSATHFKSYLINYKSKTGDKAGNVIEKSPGCNTKLETGKDGTEVTNDWVQLLISDGIMWGSPWMDQASLLLALLFAGFDATNESQRECK